MGKRAIYVTVNFGKNDMNIRINIEINKAGDEKRKKNH